MLAVMLFSGLSTLARLEWAVSAALLVATGAVLLALSDIGLIWNRFIKTIPQARLKIRVAYHLGQVLFAAGVVAQSLVV